ncbi:MAG: heparan-alpha-glucosaminide N-acetyltransferase domain-containing protein [Bacteroidota bacterium]
MPACSPLAPPSTARLVFLDVARASAILLALASHALRELEGWSLLPQVVFAGTRLLTRGATPLFLVLFGIML